jgi:hypothetical protein
MQYLLQRTDEQMNAEAGEFSAIRVFTRSELAYSRLPANVTLLTYRRTGPGRISIFHLASTIFNDTFT